MIKFIEFELTIGKAVLINVNMITAVIADVDRTKVFMQGDNSGDYISVKADYEDVRNTIRRALT